MTVQDLVYSSENSTRGLLFSADMISGGNAYINTTIGVNIFFDDIMGS